VGTKNITLSADEEMIERARLRARQEQTTLNEAFREWLGRYAGAPPSGAEYVRLMKSLRHVWTSRKFTREEMNERGVNR
jgi:hypothetical protein